MHKFVLAGAYLVLYCQWGDNFLLKGESRLFMCPYCCVELVSSFHLHSSSFMLSLSSFWQCIGATTLDEYRKHIEKDPALERRFQPVKVPEPSVNETIQILKGLRERYEIHHKLRYTDEALVAAAQLSYQYIRYIIFILYGDLSLFCRSDASHTGR